MKELQSRLRVSDRAARIFRGILHTIRHRIPKGESFRRLSQLPMFAEAVYSDQWKYKPELYKFRIIRQHLSERARPEIVELSDFNSDDEIMSATQHVLSLLSEHVSQGEMEKVKHMMPPELQSVFCEALADTGIWRPDT